MWETPTGRLPAAAFRPYPGYPAHVLISDRISENARRKEVRKMIGVLVLELESNVVSIEKSVEQLRRESQVFRRIWAHRENDTILKYGNQPYIYDISSSNTYSLQAFQASGSIRDIDNTEVLLGIFRAYDALADSRKCVETYYNQKLAAMDGLEEVSGDPPYQAQYYYQRWRTLLVHRPYRDILPFDLPGNMVPLMRQNVAIMQETIDLLRQEYRL